MRIEGPIDWYHHFPDVQMVVDEGTTLEQLLELLGVQLTEDVLLSLNGHETTPGVVLDHGDYILIRKGRA